MQRNARVQSARGMQRECGGMHGSGLKVAGECIGMQGEARGTYGSLCKVLGEYRGMRGKRMGVCAKCQGNAEE